METMAAIAGWTLVTTGATLMLAILLWRLFRRLD
jgi:hypothetical protein